MTLTIETKNSPKVYDYGESEEYGTENLCKKVNGLSASKLKLSKSNAQSGSTLATNHSKKCSLDMDTAGISETERRVMGPASPLSKQHYISEDLDEHYESGIMKLPRSSPERSPSKRPFSYSFAGSSEEEEGKVYKHMSFVDKVKEYHTNKLGNGENLNAISPSTKAESDNRKNSCFSCADQKYNESLKIPKHAKIDHGKIKTKSKL